MATKRFLGLGFTFAAQDKGLEKKLTKIRDLFSEINRISTLISRKSGKLFKLAEQFHGGGSGGGGRGSGGGSSDGAFRNSKGSSRSRSRGYVSGDKNYRPGDNAAKFSFKASAIKPEGNTKADTSTVLNSMVSDLAKNLSGDSKKAFGKESDSIVKRALKNGTKIETVFDFLAGNAERFAEQSNVISKNVGYIKMTLGYVKEWAKDVWNSLDNFLGVLGVHIRDMIPKEFTAVLGVLKAAASPMADLAKSFFHIGVKSADKAFQNKSLSGINAMKDAIGANSSLLTPQKYLSIMADMEQKKADDKSGGIFGKVGKFFKDLAYSTPFLGPVFKLLGKIIDKVAWVISVTLTPLLIKLGNIIVDYLFPSLADAGLTLGSKIGILWDGLMGLIDGAIVGLVSFIFSAAGLATIGLAIALGWLAKQFWDIRAQLVKAVSDTYHGMMKAISEMGPQLSKEFGDIWTSIKESLGHLKNAGDVCSDILKSFSDMFSGVVKAITDMFPHFGGDKPNAAPATVEMSPLAARDPKTAWSVSDMAADLSSGGPLSPAVSNAHRLQQQQLDVANSTLLLLQDIKDQGAQKVAQGGKIDVGLKTDSKAFGLQIFGQQIGFSNSNGVML